MPRNTVPPKPNQGPRFFAGMSAHNCSEVAKHGADQDDVKIFAKTNDTKSLDAVIRSAHTGAEAKATAKKKVASYMTDTTSQQGPRYTASAPAFWSSDDPSSMATLLEKLSDHCRKMTLG